MGNHKINISYAVNVPFEFYSEKTETAYYI